MQKLSNDRMKVGTAPHYDSDLRPTPRLLELISFWRR